MTAASIGGKGRVCRAPMAMLPFCGYNMANYFAHWLEVRKLITHAPRIFHLNWFRKNVEGKFMWPGFGQIMRVLKWIIDRCHGRANAHESALGWVPGAASFDIEGFEEFSREDMAMAQEIDEEEWRREVLSQDDLFPGLYSHLPKELVFQRELRVARL